MTIRKLPTAFLMLFFLVPLGIVHAQNAPPIEFDGPLFFSFPMLSSYPPYSMSMPYNVLLGYIGYDSVARHADKADVERTLKNFTYSDTAKYAAKYLYELTDYDPISFFQWLNTSPTTGMYKNAPANLRRRFTSVFDSIAPKSMNALPLLASDIIAHIRVVDTDAKTDTTASLARSAQLVRAYILDTIKGRRIPACINEETKNVEKGRHIQNTLGSCINFDYRLEWRRLNHSNIFHTDDSTLIGADGQPWVKSGTDYIVFLRFVSLRRDDTYNYASLVPVTGWGTAACMYPIIDGKVYDPYNDFGFGSELTPAQFKAALRNNINALTHP